MKVKLLFFAGFRGIVGEGEMTKEIPEGWSVSDLWNDLAESHPKLRGFSDSIMKAVNQEYVEADTLLKEGDEVAFIPPVSGGGHV